MKHEIELRPEELDLVRFHLPLPLELADEEFCRLIYNAILREADNDGWHEVVHASMDPDGFDLALRLRPQPQEDPPEADS